jgi:hypothetical protein
MKEGWISVSIPCSGAADQSKITHEKGWFDHVQRATAAEEFIA